jgi:pimeloyl-ACP methyl ester carboxylesterase
MTGFPDTTRWRAACDVDPVLAAWTGDWSVCFAVRSGNTEKNFSFVGGRITQRNNLAQFTLAAPEAVWRQFLLPTPPRHYHALLAMRMRVEDFSITGDELAFAQFCHVVRRVLDIGKFLVLGNAAPAPASLRPSIGHAPRTEIAGHYVAMTARGKNYSIHYETSGTGRDILCLHTAGADARQFHRLMGDRRITSSHRMVAFDMPWHGRSMPSDNGIPGSWRLDTDLYVELILGFIAAAKLHRPIVLGASMSGEICLELAYRHPEMFAAIVACEACDKIERRRFVWAADPRINQTFLIPEWITGLMAPQSPAEAVAEVNWHYAQGGPGVFAGDIAFYADEWDARDRVGQIDTSRCPLFMLTGEYDYSCTVEASEATAAKIPGARFQRMNRIGHFPFAENPALFADYFLPILAELA